MVKLHVNLFEDEDFDPPDIFRAAQNDDPNELMAALKHGQNLDMVDEHSRMTPLHVACIRHSLKFLEIALEQEHNPWIRDRNLRLAFDHAVAQRLNDVGKQMLQKLYPPGWNVPPSVIPLKP